MKLVKMIKLNNLQYNINHDVEVYRRPTNKEFKLQVLLNGSGTASARLEAEGQTLGEGSVSLPGTFECKFAFDTPGTRIATLTIEGDGQNVRQDLRLDVVEHEWIG
jgi:hypothetical protein